MKEEIRELVLDACRSILIDKTDYNFRISPNDERFLEKNSKKLLKHLRDNYPTMCFYISSEWNEVMVGSLETVIPIELQLEVYKREYEQTNDSYNILLDECHAFKDRVENL
jgi:hypothetical protein